METSTIFVVLGFASAFFAVLFLSIPLLQSVQSRMSITKVQNRSLPQDSIWIGFVRNGILWAKPFSRLFLRFALLKKPVSMLQAFASEKGISTTKENLLSFLIGVLGLVVIVFLFFSQSVVFALVASVCFVFLSAMAFFRKRDKRTVALREAIPDALRSMNVCFGAGLSLLQTFKQVASEIEAPLCILFKKAADELETGKTTSEALAVFKDSSINELAFIAIALDIQHKVGGSIEQVLDTARESVESEIELQRSLRVQTAQAKMSAHVVSIMPLLLVALFSFIAQDFLAPFFQSLVGFVMLMIAVAMQVGGILLVRKTLRIDVS